MSVFLARPARRRAGTLVGGATTASIPVEARSLGPTIMQWKGRVATWHQAHVSDPAGVASCGPDDVNDRRDRPRQW